MYFPNINKMCKMNMHTVDFFALSIAENVQNMGVVMGVTLGTGPFLA